MPVTFPKEIPAFRDALLAYQLPAAPGGGDPDPWSGPREALETAQGQASVVVQAVMVYDNLKPKTEDLDEDGLKLLAGACYLIAGNAWHGKGSEAFDALETVQAKLAALA